MQKRIHKRLTALLLTLCLLFTALPGAVSRTAAAETEESAADPAVQLSADCKILNYVHEEVFYAGNHIARLPSEETLSSYAFLNQDGSKTVYYLDEEVKFADADGIIREKDLTLTADLGGYTTAENDLGLSIPTNPASGVTLIWNGTAVRLIPQGGTAGETVVENNAVRYVDYYGEGMDLVYTPTLSGVKEDIVLESYTGQNTFTFMLNTGGLNLYSINGRCFLATSKTSADRIDLGDVVTFDARGRFSVGTMTAQAVTAGQIYRLTLTVDEAFLTDENTTYPVSIDPTLTVSDNTHGAGAIEDVSIYQSKPATNGNWTYLHSGYYDSTYGVARTLFRLKGLISSSTYQSLTANQVLSAQFHIWEASGTASVNVYLNANEGTATWTESGATWNNAGVVIGDLYDTQSLVSNTKAVYDITQLVKDWKSGTQNAQCGFVLKSANETSLDKAFYSSEHGTTSCRPYVVLEYTTSTPTLALNKTSVDLSVNGTTTIAAITSVGGMEISWSSSNTSVATVTSTGTVTAKSAGIATITASSDECTATCTVYVTISDGVYYLQNVLSGYWLDAGGAQIASQTDVKQSLKRISGIDQRAQLWRIHYLGNGRYSIRPLHNPRMVLHTDSTDVNLYKAGTTDTTAYVPSTARWSISYNTDGYVFKCDNSNSKALAPLYNVTTQNALVSVSTYSASNAAQRWILESVTTLDNKLILYDEDTGKYVTATSTPIRYIMAGQTLTLSQLGLETAFSSLDTINQTVTWSSSNSASVTVASGGSITGIANGKVYITATKTVNGTSYSDKYIVYCCTNSVEVDVLYDQGYLTRYPQATSRIASQLTALKEKYFSTFGIFIDVAAPTNFESYADTCSINNINSLCTHGECQNSWVHKETREITLYDYHHKNIDNILFRMDFPDAGMANLVFTGHVVCYMGTDEFGLSYHNTTTFGATYENLGIASVFNFTSQDDELRTIVHEFGHLFGAPDHYGGSVPGTNDMVGEGFSQYCIYGEKKEDPTVTSNLTICGGCQAIIEENAARFTP